MDTSPHLPPVTWSIEGEHLVLAPGNRKKPFHPADRADAFLRLLIAIAQSDAPHIHPADCGRYAAMLKDLLEFKWKQHGWGDRPDRTKRVRSGTIAEMYGATRLWVRSKLRDDDPLASSCALDATEFITAHIQGSHLGKYDDAFIGLKSLMADPYDDALLRGDRIDPQQKKEVTQYDVGGLLVKACIPPDGRLIDRKQNVCGIAGDSFLCRIRRCHLSTSTTENDSTFFAEEGGEPVETGGSGIDLGRAFTFYAALPLTTRKWPTDRVSILDPPEDLPSYLAQSPEDACYNEGLPLDLPGRWITHYYDQDSGFQVFMPGEIR